MTQPHHLMESNKGKSGKDTNPNDKLVLNSEVLPSYCLFFFMVSLPCSFSGAFGWINMITTEMQINMLNH